MRGRAETHAPRVQELVSIKASCQQTSSLCRRVGGQAALARTREATLSSAWRRWLSQSALSRPCPQVGGPHPAFSFPPTLTNSIACELVFFLSSFSPPSFFSAPPRMHPEEPRDPNSICSPTQAGRGRGALPSLHRTQEALDRWHVRGHPASGQHSWMVTSCPA